MTATLVICNRLDQRVNPRRGLLDAFPTRPGTEPQITAAPLRLLAVLVNDPEGRHYGLELSEASGVRSGTLFTIAGSRVAEGRGRTSTLYHCSGRNGVDLVYLREQCCVGFATLHAFPLSMSVDAPVGSDGHLLPAPVDTLDGDHRHPPAPRMGTHDTSTEA